MAVGGAPVTPVAVTDPFPAAQYLNLTDDERLTRPGFETMTSGATGSAAGGGHRWPQDSQGAPEFTQADIGYDEAVIDATDNGPQIRPDSRQSVTLEADIAEALVAGGAAARSPQRAAGPGRFTGPDRTVEVTGERYIVAPLDSLPLGATAADGATSYAEAAAGRDGGQVVTAGEVTP
jgi:hypothetical protein